MKLSPNTQKLKISCWKEVVTQFQFSHLKQSSHFGREPSPQPSKNLGKPPPVKFALEINHAVQVKHNCMLTTYWISCILSGKWQNKNKTKGILKLLSVTVEGQRQPEDFFKSIFFQCHSRTVEVSMPTIWCCIHVVPLNTKSCFNISIPVCHLSFLFTRKQHCSTLQWSRYLPICQGKLLLMESIRGVSQTKKMFR